MSIGLGSVIQVSGSPARAGLGSRLGDLGHLMAGETVPGVRRVPGKDSGGHAVAFVRVAEPRQTDGSVRPVRLRPNRRSSSAKNAAQALAAIVRAARSVPAVCDHRHARSAATTRPPTR